MSQKPTDRKPLKVICTNRCEWGSCCSVRSEKNLGEKFTRMFFLMMVTETLSGLSPSFSDFLPCWGCGYINRTQFYEVLGQSAAPGRVDAPVCPSAPGVSACFLRKRIQEQSQASCPVTLCQCFISGDPWLITKSIPGWEPFRAIYHQISISYNDNLHTGISFLEIHLT